MPFYAANAWMGRDVLTARPSRVEALDERDVHRRWQVDTGSGRSDWGSVWNAAARDGVFTYQLRTRTELADMRALIDYLAGRWRGIWVPSWHHDLVLTTDIGVNASTWTIRRVGFAERYLQSEARRHLVLTQPNGSLIYRRVLAVTDNGDGTETLDVRRDKYGTANATAISAVQATVSFLRWMRLDSDDIVIPRLAHNVHTVQLPFVELPADVPTV